MTAAEDRARVAGDRSVTLPPPEWEAEGAQVGAGLFDLERGRLLQLLGDLTPEDWDLPTPCPGWSVLDLCGHLLGGDLGWLARHRDDLHRIVPPSGVERVEYGFARWLDTVQDQ